MERRKVDILCVQETRWKGSKACSIGAGFKLFYYGVDSKRNGVGVVLKEEFVRNVLEVKRVSDRVMSLKLEIEGVMLNVVSGYAPQVGCELEEKERFWSELDEVMESIPTGDRVVIGVDFNGHVGEGNRCDEEVMGKFGVKERNLEGQMVVDFTKRMDMAVVNTYFQKREEHRVTYKSGGRRTQVDYILCRRGNLKEISDCKVVVGESVARQHRMVVCRMTLMVCKKKRSKIVIEKKTKWWKLKKEECCEEFRQKLRQALGGQVLLPDDWETTAEVIRETGRKVLGVSSGRRKEDKETWWWNEEVQDSIQRKRLAKKKWDMDRTEDNKQEYKELQCRVKREVSKKAYDELYTRLDTREGEKDLYSLARQRDRDGKDVQQVRVIVWKCLGEAAVEFLTSLFNRVLESERMPEEWRRSVLVPIFKNKGDMQSCSNYRGMKLMSHTMKLWKRVVEARLRKVVEICEQQYGFMPRKSTTDAIFALRILMEKYRDGQRELHCVFVDLEKAYDRVPREELWYCMRKSGVAEKYVRVVQDMYERSRTVVRCAVGQTEEFNVEVGLHQGSALRQESELEVAELKMLRFSLGVTRLDRIRNEYIRGTAHVGRLGDKVREARLRWFGHVQRRESEYIGARELEHIAHDAILHMVYVKTRLDTREGERDLYRLARQRDRDGKDVQQVRVIKDRDGRVLTSEESVQRGWKEYFEELMNEENEREKRVEGVNSVEQKVDKIRKDEVRKALKRMKSGKAVGPDDILVEVWKCLGEATMEFLTSLFNRVLESERMPEEWRRSVLVPIFKNKGDVQSCSNYRGIKLMSQTMKLWERVVEARLRKVVEICEQQYGFMPRKSTTDAIFALRILMEKYRDGQRELHCVFVDLEKAYDRVPREELWYCMRKSGVAEKYVRVVQDMYERSRTVVRCAVGQTEEFKVEVGLHQGSALSPFLFAMVMDQLSEEVRQESPWTMMFADDIVICSESREQMEENLERWRFALERRGMKCAIYKLKFLCGDGTRLKILIHLSTQDWLSKFGYLPPADPVTGQLQTKEALTQAIKAMQRFGGLEETGVFDQATLGLMKTPRCSLPDMSETETAAGRRRRALAPPKKWPKRHLSWRYNNSTGAIHCHANLTLTFLVMSDSTVVVNGSYETRSSRGVHMRQVKGQAWVRTFPKESAVLGRETVRALMYYALKVWSDITPLNFHEVAGNKADIQIDFTKADHNDGYPFDGPGGTVAHAFFPGERFTAGDTHFDDDEAWTFRSPDTHGMDLFAVAVHEFGHAIGLAHTSAMESIMRPYYQGPVGDPLKYDLPYEDKVRVWQLYGVRDSVSHTARPDGVSNTDDPPVLMDLPENRSTVPPARDAPDRCTSHFDAVAQIRGEAFFFKGKYFWRLTRDKHLVSLRPTQIHRFWRGLPANLDSIDAVYERPGDHKIVFFKGVKYWVFKDNIVEEGYPRPISDFGLPMEGVDAVFVWLHNDKTYFFKDNHYWRYDDHLRHMDQGYPKDTTLWKGIPSQLDDAMRWSDGASYFFKGKEYWRVVGSDMEVEAGYPRPIGIDWLVCKDMQSDAPEMRNNETGSQLTGKHHTDHAENGYEENYQQQGGVMWLDMKPSYHPEVDCFPITAFRNSLSRVWVVGAPAHDCYPKHKQCTYFLDWKKVACTLQVGGEVLPQVEEFKYLGVLFTSEGRMDCEIDRRIGAAAAVMRSMYRSVVVKKELSRKAKLSIYQSIYVPTLTYGHELWVMTERVRSRIQAAEMSFLRRVAGRSLRDRVRSSVTREELGVQPLLLHIERGQLRWLGHLFRMPPGRLPGGVFWACSTGKRPRGRLRKRWRDYVSRLAWERLGVPPEELEEVSEERE
ncbi:hypothetical protein QTP70_018031, partial [Hemibagrus guttatus]